MKQNSQLSDVLHVLLHMAEGEGPATSEALAGVYHQHLAARACQLQGGGQAGVAAADNGKVNVLHAVCSFRWWWPAWPDALCCAMRR